MYFMYYIDHLQAVIGHDSQFNNCSATNNLETSNISNSKPSWMKFNLFDLFNPFNPFHPCRIIHVLNVIIGYDDSIQSMTVVSIIHPQSCFDATLNHHSYTLAFSLSSLLHLFFNPSFSNSAWFNLHLISLLLSRHPPPHPQWRLFPLSFRDLRYTRNFMMWESGLYGMCIL